MDGFIRHRRGTAVHRVHAVNGHTAQETAVDTEIPADLLVVISYADHTGVNVHTICTDLPLDQLAIAKQPSKNIRHLGPCRSVHPLKAFITYPISTNRRPDFILALQDCYILHN